MKSFKNKETSTWLQTNPSLSELSSAFPHAWEMVQNEITIIINNKKPADLKRYMEHLSKNASNQKDRALKSKNILQ